MFSCKRPTSATASAGKSSVIPASCLCICCKIIMMASWSEKPLMRCRQRWHGATPEKPLQKKAPTGLTSYASKYALSERLVCGECGTLYRRCTWSKGAKKRVVWRCVSRLDYGTKYCHNSPTLDEEPLQRTILAAINSVMSKKTPSFVKSHPLWRWKLIRSQERA